MMRVVVFLAVALISGGLAANQGAPPDAVAGATLFQRSCASCHNVEGRAPSLSTGVFAHGGDDAQIAQTIRAGVPGTQMPPFPTLSAVCEDAGRQRRRAPFDVVARRAAALEQRRPGGGGRRVLIAGGRR